MLWVCGAAYCFLKEQKASILMGLSCVDLDLLYKYAFI